MRNDDERDESQNKSGALKKRLKGVRKRQRSRRTVECGVMAFKMRLVEAKQRRGAGE